MMKSYLRYEPSHSFGVICSPSSNATFDFSGNLILTAAVEEVTVSSPLLDHLSYRYLFGMLGWPRRPPLSGRPRAITPTPCQGR